MFELQRERRREVEELFAPHPVLVAPLQDDEATGLERLARHGETLFARVQPEALMSSAQRLRFERHGDGFRVHVPLPAARADQLDVVKVEDELSITTGVRRRVIHLPRRMAALDLRAARLEAATLIVDLARSAEAN
jgi:HSP20 family molecular chaperone IbpA